MELDMVDDMEVDKMDQIEMDMVADMEVNMVDYMVADINIDIDIQRHGHGNERVGQGSHGVG